MFYLQIHFIEFQLFIFNKKNVMLSSMLINKNRANEILLIGILREGTANYYIKI